MKKKSKSKFDVYQIVTDQILEKLKAGTVPWHKPWKANNQISCSYDGHEYRGINAFLALISGKEGPWITMKKANSLGGKIRKGEKSQIVVFWKWVETKETKNGKEEKKRFPFLRYYRVWSLEQTENVPEPKWLTKQKAEADEKKDTVDPIAEGERLWNEYEGKPELQDGNGRAYYNILKDFIGMPERDSFDGSEEYYSTLFHEAVHSTGHAAKLGRFPAELSALAPFGTEDYSKEELIAEMGAAFLMAEAGIEHERTLNNSVAYLKNWMSKLKSDPKLVVCAAASAQKAVDRVLGRKFEN